MPDAVRPWQHVLEALAGYLLLAEQLRRRAGDRVACASLELCPDEGDQLTVAKLRGAAREPLGRDGAHCVAAADNFQKETRSTAT